MGTIQPTLDKIIAPLSKDMAVRLVTRAKKKASQQPASQAVGRPKVGCFCSVAFLG